MSFSWSLDPTTNDIEIIDGKIKYVNYDYEVLQRVAVTLRCLQGEYEFDLEVGVPYYADVLGSKDIASIELMLRKIIGSVIGVKRVLTLTVEKRENRAYYINSTFESIYSNAITISYNFENINRLQNIALYG